MGERYQIQSLLQAGLTQTAIARQLCIHRSTISRELARNTPKRGRTARTYIGEHAQAKTDIRHQNKNKKI